jgi:hypothetical protein
MYKTANHENLPTKTMAYRLLEENWMKLRGEPQPMSDKNIFNWPRDWVSKSRAENKSSSGRDQRRRVRFPKQNMAYGSARLITLLSTLLMLSGCAGLSVHGTVGGQTIKTRVDSEVARYYVESYLAGERSDAVLDERIDRVYQSTNTNLPDRDELKHLSDEFSVDFAALYFADQIARVPANQRFRRDFEQAYDYARKAVPEDSVRLPSRYEVLIVPLYLYKRIWAVGADLSGPRAALEKVGLTTHFVETDDDGAVEANADLVADAIRARAQSGRRLLILSASKSGPEVALALTKLAPSETRHVAAWINAVGSLQGTPLADELRFPEIKLITGRIDVAGRESLTTARSRQRFDSFDIPENVLVVNYFGIPVIGSISFMLRRGFFPLRKYGPNDGVLLLADMIFPGGVTLPELNEDHLMRGKPVAIATVALAITVIRWLEAPDGEFVRVRRSDH